MFNLAQPPKTLTKTKFARETSRSGDVASHRRVTVQHDTSVSLPPHSRVSIAPGEAGPLMH